MRPALADRPRAKALRDQLTALATRAGEVRSPERLAEVEASGTPILAEAEQLAGDIEAAARRKATEAADAKRQVVIDRKARAARTKQAADARKAAQRQAGDAERERARQRKVLDALAARTTTRAGESVVGRLQAAGVVTRQVREWTENHQGFFSGKETVVRRWDALYVDADGRAWRAEQLAEWGTPGVLQVIAARRSRIDDPGPGPVPGWVAASGGLRQVLSGPTAPAALSAEALYLPPGL